MKSYISSNVDLKADLQKAMNVVNTTKVLMKNLADDVLESKTSTKLSQWRCRNNKKTIMNLNAKLMSLKAIENKMEGRLGHNEEQTYLKTEGGP